MSAADVAPAAQQPQSHDEEEWHQPEVHEDTFSSPAQMRKSVHAHDAAGESSPFLEQFASPDALARTALPDTPATE